MTTSKEDACMFSLDTLVAALEAPTKQEAARAVFTVIAPLSESDVRRVASTLAVETVRSARPRRSRRALREWIEMRRFSLLASTCGDNRE